MEEKLSSPSQKAVLRDMSELSRVDGVGQAEDGHATIRLKLCAARGQVEETESKSTTEGYQYCQSAAVMSGDVQSG